jgi:DNA damage-binding protein 1
MCAISLRMLVCFVCSMLGLGHFGHILSLFVKSRVRTPFQGSTSSNSGSTATLATIDAASSKGTAVVDEPEEMLAIVGDLMRSISLVQYYPEHQTLEEIARDFNSNWTCALEMLNDNVYLGSENWHNLFCLRRNTSSASEEIRCRLETIGEYHLGEMCNKFMAGSLVMPVSTNSGTSNRRPVRREVSPQKKPAGNEGSPTKAAASRSRRPVVSTGSQTLFATVDGTIGVIMGLDARTTAFFSTLERAMAKVIRHVGDFGHAQYRACHAERRIQPAHGFVDGDLVESFLDLDRRAMEAIVTEMNRDGNWDLDDSIVRNRDDPTEQDEAVSSDRKDQEYELSVDDILAMVEEMTMLH